MHATREQGLHVRYFPTLDSFLILLLFSYPYMMICHLKSYVFTHIEHGAHAYNVSPLGFPYLLNSNFWLTAKE